jgi:hypothetical protein
LAWGQAPSKRTFIMDCTGNLLVEITGIPLELLRLLGLDSGGDPVRVVEVGEAGAVDGGADIQTAGTMAKRQAEGSVPNIELMRRLVIGRQNVDWRREQSVATEAEDHRQMTNLDPAPRRRPFQYERREQSVSWNQHCCGANAVRTRPEPSFAAPSILNSRRRHPIDLEPDIIKIR